MNAQRGPSRPRLKRVLPYSAAGLVAVLVIVAGMWLLPVTSGGAAQQPIRFNHSVHVKLMTCNYCHQYYETRDIAGRPALFRCMMCHAYPVTDKPEAAKLQKYAADRQEVPWVRLTRLPDYVHFSHRRHVVVAKLECKTCHGDIAQTTAPPTAPLVTIRMQFCLNCHTSKAVELTPRAVQALQTSDMPPDVQEALWGFENKRFSSPADLVAALAHAAGTAPADAERQQILSQVQPAPPVTTDCIGCHR
jgi:Cytochrome c7 and related cytochrome c/Class III cytochrome C family